jgi:hypothetical protein
MPPCVRKSLCAYANETPAVTARSRRLRKATLLSPITWFDRSDRMVWRFGARDILPDSAERPLACIISLCLVKESVGDDLYLGVNKEAACA